VHFLLTSPSATFMVDLTIGLVPAHVLAPRGGLDGEFDEDYVGCGPFRFISRYRDQKIVLARNPLYWEEVKPEYLVVRTIPDEATRVLSVMAGSGHIVVNALSPPVVRTLEQEAEVKVFHQEAASTTYMAFNLLDSRLADVRVRRAIALGFSREAIVREQFGGMATVAHSVLPPLHWAHTDKLDTYAYSPTRARELLDDAGLPVSPETGYRATFTLKVTTDRFRQNIGALIAYKLGALGIKVELCPLELSTFLADVRKGNFQLYILQLPEVTEPDILRWLIHSQAAPVLTPQEGTSRFGQVDRTIFPPQFKEVEGPLASLCRTRWRPMVLRQGLQNALRRAFGLHAALGSGNRSFFFDPELDCALDLAHGTMVRPERLRLYRRAQQILAAELPVLPLWHEDNIAVVRHDVEGYHLLPINRYSPVKSVSLTGRKTSPP